MRNWKFKRDDLVSDDLRIIENVYWGAKGKHKNYSLYLKTDLLFTGTLTECKEYAENKFAQ